MSTNRSLPWCLTLALTLAACGGAGSSGASRPLAPAASSASPTVAPVSSGCRSASTPQPLPPGPSPQPANGLKVPTGLRAQVIAHISDGPRELAFAPNGDLFVGTDRANVYIVSNAEAAPAAPRVFAAMNDAPAAGVTVSMHNCSIYVGTQFGVYQIPYNLGDITARTPKKIASVRPDGSGDHSTTTVAVSGTTLYASVGSSCNACTESDSTRATIQQMHLDGSAMTPKAIHIRNAIGLSVNSASGALWAGDAGQDSLPAGHPYEFFDDVSRHAGVADYGWPRCEENHVAYQAGANCSSEVVPLVEFPAYETIIGTTFYEPPSAAAHALPSAYRGGAFVAMHGSWHTNASGIPVAPPFVAFVPMSADSPKTAVDWKKPTTQWSAFLTGFQSANGSRIGRPTGVAVGPQGSLFVADDQSGYIYRIRP